MTCTGFKALLIFMCLVWCARAEVFKYTDESGRTHYVDRASKIPLQYRENASSKELPALTKYKPVERKSYNKPVAPSTRGLNNKEVTIYVTTWCPHCKRLETFLNQKKIRYTRYDVEKDDKGRAEFAKLGGGGVPVVKIGTQIFRGFNPAQIGQALAK